MPAPGMTGAKCRSLRRGAAPEGGCAARRSRVAQGGSPPPWAARAVPPSSRARARRQDRRTESLSAEKAAEQPTAGKARAGAESRRKGGALRGEAEWRRGEAPLRGRHVLCRPPVARERDVKTVAQNRYQQRRPPRSPPRAKPAPARSRAGRGVRCEAKPSGAGGKPPSVGGTCCAALQSRESATSRPSHRIAISREGRRAAHRGQSPRRRGVAPEGGCAARRSRGAPGGSPPPWAARAVPPSSRARARRQDRRTESLSAEKAAAQPTAGKARAGAESR